MAASALSLTAEDIQRAVEAANADPNLDENGKKRIAELELDARTNLDRSHQAEASAASFKEKQETATARRDDLKKRLADLERTAPKIPGGLQVSQLEQMLVQNHGELTKQREARARLESQTITRGTRRSEIHKRLDEIEASQTQIRQLVTVATRIGESKSMSSLKMVESLARYQALEHEKNALNHELEMFDAESAVDILQVERSLSAKEIAQLTEIGRLLENELQTQRNVAATKLEDTAKADERVPEASWLHAIAKRNRELAEWNSRLTSQIADTEDKLRSTRGTLEEWKQKFKVTKDKIESVGLPATVGTMLRQLKLNLPNVQQLRHAIRKRGPLVDRSQLDQFDLVEDEFRLENIDKEVDRVLLELRQIDKSTPMTQEARDEVRPLLERRKEIIDALYKNEQKYVEYLTDLDLDDRELANLSEEFRAFIDERVLWVRSEPPLLSALSSPDGIPSAYGEVAQSDWVSLLRLWSNRSTWETLLTCVVEDVRSDLATYFAAFLFFTTLTGSRALITRNLRQIAERTRSSSYSHFSPTFRTLLLTLAAALLLPSVCFFLSWRFGRMVNGGVLTVSLATSMKLVGATLASLLFVKQVYRQNGLADAHFDVPPRTLRLVRTNLRWFTWAFVPILAVGLVAKGTGNPASGGVVHRLFFIASCIVASVFAWRVCYPKHGVLNSSSSKNQDDWFHRLHMVWFWGCVQTPILLATLSAFGYAYSAQQLAQRIFLTLSAGAILLVLKGLAMRWLLVHRRKLSIAQARARYEEFARKKAEEAASSRDETSGTTQPPIELPGVEVTSDGIVVSGDPLADLRANTAQSQRLLSTLFIVTAFVAGWMIWSDILPALSILELEPLWYSTEQVAEEVKNPQGNEEIRYVEVLDPVTITDVLTAILIAGLAFVSARDVPGLLEIAILERLPMETSVRYAITTLGSYAIGMVGLVFACRWVGLHWQQVQWLATALTFGLAFGLQEMFANFVAGVIILFERPIRVGDIVTIDEVTGIVSRVRMRATTVTNWDRKDYIVPNKDFITGRLLNWTLSDKFNRIVVEVGVAYGSDTDQAKRLLIEAAKEHSIVVDDPPAMATFEQFGDSALILNLRCFISMKDMPMRLSVVDELHSSIDRRFANAGIEIAFPQQDIHIRQWPHPPSD